MKAAIVGGTGRLGAPVAKALQQAGIAVTIVTRNATKAAKQLGDQFSYVEASLDDVASLERALFGMDAVHINLAGSSEKECDRNIRQGAEHIALAAKNLKLKLISLISGTTVCEQNTHFYDIKAKYEAEQALISSGLPYLIFCPSWFMESLPQFVNGGRASLFGPGEQTTHWVAAADYAQMVARAYLDSRIRNKRLLVHGPQAISMRGALEQYVQFLDPDLAVTTAPYWLGTVLSMLTGKAEIRHAARMCRYFEAVGDLGDAAETTRLLGAPTTELSQWCAAQFKQDGQVVNLRSTG